MKEVYIDEELQGAIPALTSREYADLEAMILADGKIRVALDVWDGAIVDGHNRFNIATIHDLPYDVHEMHFDSKSQAIAWMIANQIARRNMSTVTKAVMVMKNKPYLIAAGKEIMSKKGSEGRNKQLTGRLSTLTNAQDPHDTRKIMANMIGVSAGTLHKMEYVYTKNPMIWARVELGERTVNAAYLECKQIEMGNRQKEMDEQQRIAEDIARDSGYEDDGQADVTGTGEVDNSLDAYDNGKYEIEDEESEDDPTEVAAGEDTAVSKPNHVPDINEVAYKMMRKLVDIKHHLLEVYRKSDYIDAKVHTALHMQATDIMAIIEGEYIETDT